MMSIFRKLMPREDRFFDMFNKHSETVVTAAQALDRLLSGKNVQANCDLIVTLEDQADDITRDVLLAVRRSFITPFDRGDIKDLIQSMDDAIDMMHKTVKTIRLFEQTSFDPLMQQMGHEIVKAAGLIAETIRCLKGRHECAASFLDRRGDYARRRPFRRSARPGPQDLFKRHGAAGDAMAYMIGSEIYGELEKVVDRFEDVANEISGIVIENV